MCESPATSIGECKAGNGSGNKANSESNLFGHALLYGTWEGGFRVEEMVGREGDTGVCLNASRDLTPPDRVEVGDILTEDSLEVLLTNALDIYFSSVNHMTM